MAAAAVQTLEQAVSARLDTSMGHVFLGEAYASQKPPRTDAALDQFRTAIEQKPDNLAALRSAIALLVEKGDHAAIDEATVYYKRGLAFYPRDKSLADMGDVFGADGEAVLARELTKMFETVLGEPLAELAARVVSDPDQQRGEHVILVAGRGEEADAKLAEGRRVFAILREELPPAKAAKLAAAISGAPRKSLYESGN